MCGLYVRGYGGHGRVCATWFCERIDRGRRLVIVDATDLQHSVSTSTALLAPISNTEDKPTSSLHTGVREQLQALRGRRTYSPGPLRKPRTKDLTQVRSVYKAAGVLLMSYDKTDGKLKVLLTKTRDGWSLLGGKRQPDENDPLDTSTREVQEESQNLLNRDDLKKALLANNADKHYLFCQNGKYVLFFHHLQDAWDLPTQCKEKIERGEVCPEAKQNEALMWVSIKDSGKVDLDHEDLHRFAAYVFSVTRHRMKEFVEEAQAKASGPQDISDAIVAQGSCHSGQEGCSRNGVLGVSCSESLSLSHSSASQSGVNWPILEAQGASGVGAGVSDTLYLSGSQQVAYILSSHLRVGVAASGTARSRLMRRNKLPAPAGRADGQGGYLERGDGFLNLWDRQLQSCEEYSQICCDLSSDPEASGKEGASGSTVFVGAGGAKGSPLHQDYCELPTNTSREVGYGSSLGDLGDLHPGLSPSSDSTGVASEGPMRYLAGRSPEVLGGGVGSTGGAAGVQRRNEESSSDGATLDYHPSPPEAAMDQYEWRRVVDDCCEPPGPVSRTQHRGIEVRLPMRTRGSQSSSPGIASEKGRGQGSPSSGQGSANGKGAGHGADGWSSQRQVHEHCPWPREGEGETPGKKGSSDAEGHRSGPPPFKSKNGRESRVRTSNRGSPGKSPHERLRETGAASRRRGDDGWGPVRKFRVWREPTQENTRRRGDASHASPLLEDSTLQGHDVSSDKGAAGPSSEGSLNNHVGPDQGGSGSWTEPGQKPPGGNPGEVNGGGAQRLGNGQSGGGQWDPSSRERDGNSSYESRWDLCRLHASPILDTGLRVGQLAPLQSAVPPVAISSR